MSWEILHNVIRGRFKSQVMANTSLSTPTLTSATVSASTTDDSYNDATEDLSVFDGYRWVNVSGFTDSGNNGIRAVEAVTADKITVAENLVTEALGDTVTISAALPVIFDNDSVDIIQNNMKHVVLFILTSGAENIEIGAQKLDRSSGEMIAQVRVPTGQGDKAALEIADVIRAAFDHLTDTGVVFKTPYHIPTGRMGAFHQITVHCPFTYDITST